MPGGNLHELARLQAELTQSTGNPYRPSVRARIADLLRDHGAQWAGPRATLNWKQIPDDVEETQFVPQFGPVFGEQDQWQFQNGNLEVCSTTASDFLLHADAIVRQTRLKSLALRGIGGRSLVEMRRTRIEKYRRLNAPDVILENELRGLAEAEQLCPPEQLLECESLLGITSLRFEQLGLVGEELEPFLDAPFVRDVEKLYLYQFTDAHRQAYQKLGQFRFLRDLDIEFWSDGCGDRGIEVGNEEDARVLASSATLSSLETIRLRYHEIGDNGMIALVGSPHLSRLHTLDLRGNYSSITDSGLIQLAAMPEAGRLRRLNLSQCDFSNDGTLALARSPHFQNLQELQLSPLEESYENWKGISGEEFAIELGKSDCLPELRSLNVSNQIIGDIGISAIANSPRFRKLQSLVLNHQGISDDGLIAVANSPFPPTLRELHLRWNDFGDRAFAVLCQSQIARMIEVLTITGTSNTGSMLADSRFDSLFELRIHRLDESVLQPLADTDSLKSLRRLIFQSGDTPNTVLRRKKHAPVHLLKVRA